MHEHWVIWILGRKFYKQTDHKNIDEEWDLIEPSNKEKIVEEIIQPPCTTKKLVDATLDIPRLIMEGSIESEIV